MDFKIMLIGILCAINLVHAGDRQQPRRPVLTVEEDVGIIGGDADHRRVIRDTSHGKGVQLGISEPISNNNNNIVINRVNYSASESKAAALNSNRDEFTTEQQLLANETTATTTTGDWALEASATAVTGFPFTAHESLTAPIGEGQSDDAFPPGFFPMANATCSENEDLNCIIDHNITCVGDPSFCNLTYDEYMELLNDYIYPSIAEWILIFSHAVVFIMGLVSLIGTCDTEREIPPALV